MPNNEIVLENTPPMAELGLIPHKSCATIGEKVNDYLLKWRQERKCDQSIITLAGYKSDSYIVSADCPRFGSGEAKGLIKQSVRGLDLYILVDVTNYSLTYSVCGHENHMSPDDIFCDLKRIIAAAMGKAKRITVIIPFLYEGRQHRRSARESLDCAMALQELINMGVDNIITFDAHDPRVQNAIPLNSFETVSPTYQFLKGILKNCKDLKLDNDHLMIISPDEGGTKRAVYMASVLGVNVGMFYKRRDYSRIVDGRNPIVAHESGLIGEDSQGIPNNLMPYIFTNGMAKFDKAVEDGIIYKVVTTNLTYIPEEVSNRDYLIKCDMSKYIAYIIDTLNHECSISELLNPYGRIEKLINRYKNGEY